MEKLYADLHLHTTFSDGSFTPTELVKQAHKESLAAISITDHDITDGIDEALIEGAKRGIEVIPGVELSVECKGDSEKEMHILGYYINWQNLKFQEELKLFRQARERRAFHILDKLYHLGIKLDEERLFKIAGIGSIGRLHFARAMLEQRFVNHTQEAFEKYLGEGRPAYVPKIRLRPEEAIKIIYQIGGIPVLAHPFYGGFGKNILRSLVNKGLLGIEVWHTKHPPEVTKTILSWAKEFNLVTTGGTDCHGKIAEEPQLIGKLKVDYEVVLKLKELKAKLEFGKRKILE